MAATRPKTPATPEPAAPDRLSEAQERFVQAWGQMAGAWGVTRTMAEAHALLYITGEPHNSDDLMHRLRISRGNASMTLRALLDWGLVTKVHKRGDRKEYFRAEQDVWTVLRTILRERAKRELAPMLASLHEIRDLTSDDADTPTTDHNARLDAMLEFATIADELIQRCVEADAPTMLGDALVGAGAPREGPA
ncbi:MAG: transcriptional regulator [Phycisphaerales bacterium]|nr:MAG: transcriptional regulator [Phycisphaerales bacterium]